MRTFDIFFNSFKKITCTGILIIIVCNISIAQNGGTISGSPGRSTALPTAISSNGSCISYDGVDDNITSSSNIVLGVTGAISLWFQPNSFGRIVAANSTDADTYVYLSASNQIIIQTDGGDIQSFAVPTMSSSTWYNLIINRDAGITHLFLNGTESSTGGVSQSGDITINQFGKYYDNTGPYASYIWNGKLADIKKFNSALSSIHISNIYSGTCSGSTSSLYWKLNELTGDDTVTDDITEGCGGTSSSSEWITSGNNIYNSNSGSVGIGVGATDMNADYKLFVATGIRTRKLKVDAPSVSWPDYVFHKDYKLPGLEELEKYVNLNQRLPGVPSAEDVEKNGMDIGTNQALLLRKIEELTLLLIKQNKTVTDLKFLIKQQNKRIGILEKK